MLVKQYIRGFMLHGDCSFGPAKFEPCGFGFTFYFSTAPYKEERVVRITMGSLCHGILWRRYGVEGVLDANSVVARAHRPSIIEQRFFRRTYRLRGTHAYFPLEQ